MYGIAWLDIIEVSIYVRLMFFSIVGIELSIRIYEVSEVGLSYVVVFAAGHKSPCAISITI